MRRYLLSFIFCLFVAVSLFQAGFSKDEEPDAETEAMIEDALREAVIQNRERALSYLVYETGIDNLRVSEDGSWAVLWLSAIDRQTGETIAMEPGLGIGKLQPGGWRVFLPSDPAYMGLFNQLPANIMPESERTYWQRQMEAVCDTSAIGPFSGYFLPWEAGRTLFLTQSIYHTLGWGYNPSYSMIHSFDFSTSPSSLFDIWAAKSGTVKYFWDGQTNGDESSPGNYIVLEDTSTTPTSYVLYLHLAQGSIPAELKTVGAGVKRGQFIGVADDTGVSSNHHLHFQVHTEVNWWGCSVDVLFSDVFLNGGRPRLAIEAQNYPQYGSEGQSNYTSGNLPPIDVSHGFNAAVISPNTGHTITQPEINITARVSDPEHDILSAQFVINDGAGWQPLGLPVINPSQVNGIAEINGSFDLCSLAVPVGPFSLGVHAEDSAGHKLEPAGAVGLINLATCTSAPPACAPAGNEVALFELPDYQGACQVLAAGIHLENYAVSSLMVGADAAVTLYKEAIGLTGRSQTFTQDNANLADDWSGNDTFQAAIVTLKTQSPGDPRPTWPAPGETIAQGALSLLWDDGGGGTEFQVRLSGPTQVITSSWQSPVAWSPGDLTPGTYSWQVRARNNASESDWSALRDFTVSAVSLTASSVTAPYTETFNLGLNGWVVTGLWNRLPSTPGVTYEENSWWYGAPAGDYANGTYDTGGPNTGSLTSPPIDIPSSGTFYLRYYSMYQTEQNGDQWDRRKVQVSADWGPFVDLYHHQQDLMDGEEGSPWWVRSPYLSLAAFSGQTIRVRFVFESMDKYHNDYAGWLVDQLTINAEAPPACSGTNEPDHDPTNASIISLSSQTNAELCPAGDVDFYQFSATAGQRVSINVDAKSIGSPLDSYVTLYDTDGRSVLAENDDELFGVLRDPLLAYTIQRDGSYYIQVRRWNHPNFLYNNYTYSLIVGADSEPPVITEVTASEPLTDIDALSGNVVISATITETGLGVSRVKFYFHTGKWSENDWLFMGDDLDGTDGWSVEWDTSAFPAQEGMAIVVVAYDDAYNYDARGLWNLFVREKTYLPLINK